MLKAVLIDPASGKALHVESYQHEGEDSSVLLITTIPEHYGVFKTTKFTVAGGAGSTTIAEPEADGSLRLTDLVVSFEKKATAEVTIQFNDGSNSELVWFADMQDAPLSLAIAFAGNWRGWRSAYLEVVVATAGLDGSVGVGYVKYLKDESLPYAEWNARR